MRNNRERTKLTEKVKENEGYIKENRERWKMKSEKEKEGMWMGVKRRGCSLKRLRGRERNRRRVKEK